MLKSTAASDSTGSALFWLLVTQRRSFFVVVFADTLSLSRLLPEVSGSKLKGCVAQYQCH